VDYSASRSAIQISRDGIAITAAFETERMDADEIEDQSLDD
jgi:hypothetical protein